MTETHGNRTETHACDLIDRQAAVDAIQRAYADTEGGDDKCAVWKNVGLTSALHIMQDLPSAQPERTGRWIKVGHIEHTYLISKCSVCGYQTIDAGNYCTNCGSHNGGGHEST